MINGQIYIGIINITSSASLFKNKSHEYFICDKDSFSSNFDFWLKRYTSDNLVINSVQIYKPNYVLNEIIHKELTQKGSLNRIFCSEFINQLIEFSDKLLNSISFNINNLKDNIPKIEELESKFQELNTYTQRSKKFPLPAIKHC